MVVDGKQNGADEEKSRLMLPFVWLLSVIFSLLNFVLMIGLPQFLELFEGFGADIPAYVLITLRWGWIVSAILLFAIIGGSTAMTLGCEKDSYKVFKRKALLVLGADLVTLLWTVFAIGAAYTPIFVFGSVS